MGDLEVYVVAARCRGLERGAYHYDAHEHGLTRIEPQRAETIDRLLADARQSSGINQDPHVLLIFSARVTRGLWKYSSMYYSLALKNVGALMQTCYLVATAMNLAPCSLGLGDAELFADLTGCGYFEECSVGEFMLGSSAES